MKLTTAISHLPMEDCIPPAPGVAPLPEFVEPLNEFRLIPMLREAAGRKNPWKILARAAAVFHRAQPKDVELGNALADLAVTGRVAYKYFQQTPVNQLGKVEEALHASLAQVAPPLPPETYALLVSLRQATPARFASAVNAALDRAYAVAWALRGPVAQRAALREPLHWIAVSGEDDTPHRPVNVAPPRFERVEPKAVVDLEQFEIPVTVAVGAVGARHDLTIQTRFFIASAVEGPAPAGIVPLTRDVPPNPVPHIPDGHQVILFLHGHSSSAEEACDIIPHIHKAGLDCGRKYSIVSLDLPNSGYSEMFDHEKVAPSAGTSWPGAPTDYGPVLTPILKFMEDFVVAFVDALEQTTPIKSRFAGIIGGSLGGNLGLILGRRPLAANPWLNAAIVSWSPASVWPPKLQNLGQSLAPKHCAGLWIKSEDLESRGKYFAEVYDSPFNPLWSVTVKQPELWYRDGWPCKQSYITGSRIARREIYNASFRRWHWRLAGEQLIYSHVDRVVHGDNTTRFRFEDNTVRLLLVAGADDNYPYVEIYSCTQAMAVQMVNTPGLTLFLMETGHSIHLERPRFFAGEIVNFLNTIDISFLVPLLLSGPG